MIQSTQEVSKRTLSVNPRITDTTTGKNQSVDCAAAINDSQPQIAFGRNVREGIEFIPHACTIESTWWGYPL